MRRYKAIAVATVLLIAVIAFSSCIIPWDPIEEYGGEYPDLWTTAVYSIIGIVEPTEFHVKVYERDNQGRVLFGFGYKHTLSGSPDYNKLCFLVIMQKSEDGKAYYYSNNYLCRELDLSIEIADVNAIEHFDNESIELLKTSNDWNCSYNNSKMYCSKIVGHKYLQNESKAVERNYKKINSHSGKIWCGQYLTDSENNKLYLTWEYYNNDQNVKYYLMIIDNKGQMPYPDGFIEVKDVWNCKEELENLLSRDIWKHV